LPGLLGRGKPVANREMAMPAPDPTQREPQGTAADMVGFRRQQPGDGWFRALCPAPKSRAMAAADEIAVH